MLPAGEGYKVHAAGDAEEAMRLLRLRIILMDIQLPPSSARYLEDQSADSTPSMLDPSAPRDPAPR